MKHLLGSFALALGIASGPALAQSPSPADAPPAVAAPASAAPQAPGGIQSQNIFEVKPDASADPKYLEQTNGERAKVQPGNNAPMWRQVGQGVTGTSSLQLDGPATFWITGEIKAAGTILTDDAKPGNLMFRVIGSGDVTFSGNSALAADVYAPESDVTINGNPTFAGGIIGKSLNIVGNATLHYDRQLAKPTITWNTYAIVR